MPIDPPLWSSVATFGRDMGALSPLTIDEVSNPKGAQFANWMLNVGASTVRGKFNFNNGGGQSTASAVDPSKAQVWVTSQLGNDKRPQMFQFTTPLELPEKQRCGKVVFADMHVSEISNVSEPFPRSCPGGETALDLSAQEKALAYMFFEIASCTGTVD